jgi:hypothetical protein
MEYKCVLMENYDKALGLQKVSLNSAGSAMEKFNVYQESGAAASERLKTAFEKVFMSIDSGGLTSLINFGTGVLTLINNVGGLQTILSILSIFLFANLPKAFLAATGALRTFITTASTAQLALGWIGVALTVVSIAFGVYTSAVEKNRQEIIKKFNLSESANSNETLPLFVNVEGDSVVFSLFDFSELNEGQESEGLDQW